MAGTGIRLPPGAGLQDLGRRANSAWLPRDGGLRSSDSTGQWGFRGAQEGLPQGQLQDSLLKSAERVWPWCGSGVGAVLLPGRSPSGEAPAAPGPS